MLNTYKTALFKKIQLNSNTYLFNFALLEPKEIIFKPGQYVMLKVPQGENYISRLYSIASSAQEKNNLELIVEIVPNGLGSDYLSGLKINDEAIFQGPAGMFTLKNNDKNKIFMVTGTGIAPILSMIKSKFQISNFKFQIFWGLKTYKDVYLLDEIRRWGNVKICLSREQNLEMIPESDKKYFTLGHADKAFEEFITTDHALETDSDLYLCGGRNMVEDFKQFLLTKKVPAENIIFEKF